MKNLNNKIKKSGAILVLMALLTIPAYTQMGEVGLRFMPTFSSTDINISSGGKVEGEATLGFGAGVLIGYNFSEYVGVQGEIMYSSLTQRYKEEEIEREINLRYINIPLLLSLNTGKTKVVNVNVVIGPQIGISVGSSITDDGSNVIDPVLSVKKGDLGVAYGAGIDFGLNALRTLRLGVGYRGVRGLIDISDDSKSLSNDSYYVLDKAHTKSNSIYFGVSYLF